MNEAVLMYTLMIAIMSTFTLEHLGDCPIVFLDHVVGSSADRPQSRSSKGVRHPHGYPRTRSLTLGVPSAHVRVERGKSRQAVNGNGANGKAFANRRCGVSCRVQAIGQVGIP